MIFKIFLKINYISYISHYIIISHSYAHWWLYLYVRVVLKNIYINNDFKFICSVTNTGLKKKKKKYIYIYIYTKLTYFDHPNKIF